MRTVRILARGSHVSTLCIKAAEAPRGSTVPVPVSRKHVEDMFSSCARVVDMFSSCARVPHAVDARERQLLQVAVLVS